MSWAPTENQLFCYYFLTFELAVLGMLLIQTIIVHLLLKLNRRLGK